MFSPEWLDEWLDDGARPHRAAYSSAGPAGYEGRFPRVRDVWELLELLLEWWAERVCAVAAGVEGERSGTAAAVAQQQQQQQQQQQRQQQQRGRGGGGGHQRADCAGSSAGDAGSAALQAVESVQVRGNV